jgi:hypothetical protein
VAKGRTPLPTLPITVEPSLPFPSPTLPPKPEPEPTKSTEPGDPPLSTDLISGKVLSGANVRPFPSVQNDPVGVISQGDEILFVGMSPDGMWYHIRLGDRHADSSSIGDTKEGTGWVHRELVSSPKGEVPVEETEMNVNDTPPSPEPTATPTPP